MGYRTIINGIALKVLINPVDIPDYHLMIETAEKRESVPLVISQSKIPRKVAESLEKLETLSNDTIEQAIAENMLEINDFNGNTAIISGMIGGAR